MGKDSRIIRPQEFLGKQVPEARKNELGRPLTEGRAAELIYAGVAVGAKNVYDQLSTACADMFEQLEELVTQRVLTELEMRRQRALHRRVGRWIRRTIFRRPVLELTMPAAPPLRPPVEAKDAPTEEERE